MEITPRRRRALSTFLALVLAVESVSAVAAAARVGGDGGTTGGPSAAPSAAAASVRSPTATVDAGVRDRRPATVAAGRTPEADSDAGPAPTQPTRPAPAQVTKAEKASKAGPASPAAYRGRNHVWIPALRIDRGVHAFPCDRQRPPDNHVYRWGCAGGNNVYLMGHAYSVFKPLHDAYVSGRLKRGMKAYYADAKGRVRVFKVKWWRVTLPTPDAKWAWASLRTPSMTLQTCVGRNSKYRLMVRLVAVR